MENTTNNYEYYNNRYVRLYRNNWRSRIFRYLSSARNRHGNRVTITAEQLLEQLQKQEYKCYYTGISLNTEPEFGKGPKNMSVSLDRLDSAKSYEPGNVVFCLWKINKAKSKLTEQEFLEMCQNVVDWNNRTK